MVIKEHHLYHIVDYFKKNLRKGYPKETLQQALIRQGYARLSIQKALEIAQDELAQEAPQLKSKPVIKREAVEEVKIESKPFWKRFFG